ncbi:hypothetical protein SAMN04488241_111122 [Sphingomonas rubra]|uniref:DUF559 domain-containing protein n=1 Tax=Sphingomonas rubra TaxID=634430 RepID=A0A1I5UGG5_9SPHN|nr:hypothetical protein SAMN04488241_111122 [Sphingomonas rubra]
MGGVRPASDPPRSRGGSGRAAVDGGGRPRTLRQPAVYDARHARREMSLPEVLLWQRLKGSPDGTAFRKQHPIVAYAARPLHHASGAVPLPVNGED